MMNKIDKIIKDYKRLEKKPIKTNGKPYFDIEDIIDLEKYLIYIVVSSRGAGKTYSSFNFALNFALRTGMYIYWLRLDNIEKQNMIQTNLPNWTAMGWIYDRNALYTSKPHPKIEGKLVKDQCFMRFGAISTLHKLKSTFQENCAGIIADEFMPASHTMMSDRLKYINMFEKLTQFVSTIERDGVAFLILLANANKIDNPIFDALDIDSQDNDIKDLDRKLRVVQTRGNYRVIDDAKSTAFNMASNDEALQNQMYRNQYRQNVNNILLWKRLNDDDTYDIKYNVQLMEHTLTFSIINRKGIDYLYVTMDLSERLNKTIPIYTIEGLTFSNDNYRNSLDIEGFVGLITRYFKSDNVFYESFKVKTILLQVMTSGIFLRTYLKEFN